MTNNRSMDVHVVIPLEFAEPTGGMLHSVHLLIRRLADRARCTVIVPAASATGEMMANAGATVVETSSLPYWTISRHSPVATMQTFRRVRSAVRATLGPGSVLLTNNIAAELICGMGQPFPNTPRVFVNRGNEYRGVSKTLLRRSLRGVGTVVATTSYQAKIAMTMLGVRTRPIEVIPNAVDQELIQVSQTIVKPWKPHKVVRLAVIGFPSEGKNQQLLIRAVAELRARGIVASGHLIGSPGSEGDIRYMDILHTLVSNLRLELSIHFDPFIADKAQLYSNIDIVVSTSCREGFGRTIIEGMVMRRPVIALRAGGPECIIENGVNGILLDKDDPACLADAIAAILTMPAASQRMIDRAYARVVKDYSEARVAEQYWNLLLKQAHDTSATDGAVRESPGIVSCGAAGP